MSKFPNIYPKLKSVLEKLPARNLINYISYLGLRYEKTSKQKMINYLIQQSYKNDIRYQILVKRLKLQGVIFGQDNKITHQEPIIKKVDFNLKLKWQQLKNIVDHEEKKLQHFSKYFQKKQSQQAKQCQISNIIPPPQQAQKAKKTLSRNRRYLQITTSNPQHKYPWFHKLNITTEIIYLQNKITTKYQNYSQHIKQLLLKQDIVSFNTYILDSLPSQLKFIIKINRSTKRIKTTHHAQQVMKIIKQYQYHKFNNLFNFYLLTSSLNQINIKQLQQFFIYIQKYPKFFIQKLSLKNTNSLLTIIKLMQYSSITLQSGYNKDLSWKLLNASIQLMKMILKQKKDQLKQNNLQLKNTLQEIINRWLNFTSNYKLVNIFELKYMLKHLYNFEQFLQILPKQYQITSQSVYSNKYYQIIMKEVIQTFQKIFSTQYSQQIFSSMDINQILFYFQYIFRYQKLPNQIMKLYLINAYQHILQLKLSTKKCVLYMMNKISINNEDDEKMLQLMTSILQSLINLTPKQLLFAIKLAISNPITKKQTVIYNLIIYNLLPISINLKLKNYLLDIIHDHISNQLIQQELILYINNDN